MGSCCSKESGSVAHSELNPSQNAGPDCVEQGQCPASPTAAAFRLPHDSIPPSSDTPQLQPPDTPGLTAVPDSPETEASDNLEPIAREFPELNSEPSAPLGSGAYGNSFHR